MLVNQCIYIGCLRNENENDDDDASLLGNYTFVFVLKKLSRMIKHVVAVSVFSLCFPY